MAIALWPLALLFGAVVALRRAAYRVGLLGAGEAGIPVVVIGNLSLGGTGKTPLALHVAQTLQRHGWTPAIVSRGYGGQGDAPRAVGATSAPEAVGDEPVLLAQRGVCPVWVGADRLITIRRLRSAHPQVDVVVLDDGLQHYALRRDLEIAVVDARALGNGLLFPAGPLREPARRLRAVNAIVAHDLAPEALARIAPEVPAFAMTLAGEVAEALDEKRAQRPLGAFAGGAVHAIAGIGDPDRFFARLRGRGLQVIAHPFPDHHRYTARDLAFGDALPVLMTEKDAVKCRAFATPHHWVVPVSAAPEGAFDAWLVAKLEECRAKQRRSETA